MLFYLSDSLVVPEDNPNYKKIFSAVRNLVIAATQGKHEITAEYNTLSAFERWYVGDYEVSGYLHKKRVEYSTSISINTVSYYIKVEKDVPQVGVKQIDFGLMPFSDFLDNDRVAQTSLIGENDYDCQFFEWILKWYKNNYHSDANLTTCMSYVNGSGGETPSAITKELNKKHVSVCIVDTDIRFPGDKIGRESTCRKCREVVKKEAPYFRYMELDVHEIENLIPINYLEHIDKWNGESKHKKNAFDRISGDPEIMRYFDLKNGVQKSNTVGDPLYEFGRRCYSLNPDFFNTAPYEDYYHACSKCVYPGLNERALKHTLDFLNNNKLAEKPILLDFQKESWKRIGKVLLDFCISHNPESVY